MNFSIELGLHSSEKDHETMTWGTLTLDKTVKSSDALTLYTYGICMFTECGNPDFHKGMHTLEHLLAYSKDTGSVRASIEECDPNFSGKWILDISPYRFSPEMYGVRMTSLVEIPSDIIVKSFWQSVNKALTYCEKIISGQWDENGYLMVPFASPKQCGQYNFHSPEYALKMLQKMWTISEDIMLKNEFSSEYRQAFVCDLRMLKPKLFQRDDMIMFSPELSYTLSEKIERELPKKLPGRSVIVGTFGCMTGMYLCFTGENASKEELMQVQKAIYEIISEMDISSFTSEEKRQIQCVFENYKNFGITQ